MRERRLAARELSLRLRCRLTEDPVDQLAIGDSAHGVFFLSDAMRNISVAVKIHRAPGEGAARARGAATSPGVWVDSADTGVR